MKTLKTLTTAGIFLLTGVFLANEAAALNTAHTDTTVVAKTTNEKELFSTFEEGILYGLDSDVTGIVESTLYNAVSYKIAYPEFGSEKVISEINKVALEGATHTLRYKAYLTLAYYKNQDQFDAPESMITKLNVRDKNQVFYSLQDQVQAEQFTAARQ